MIAVSAFAALGGFLFLSTLYLQNVRGLYALHAGLWMLPMAVMIFVCAPLSGRLVGSRGPRLLAAHRGVCDDGERGLFAAFDAETSNVTLVIGYFLFGLGFGFVNAPITNTAVSGMPRAQAGVAAAVASTSRQIGRHAGGRGDRRGTGVGDRVRPVQGGVRRRGTARLVDHRRLRSGRTGPGRRHHRRLGPAYGGADRPNAWWTETQTPPPTETGTERGERGRVARVRAGAGRRACGVRRGRVPRGEPLL